MRVIGLIGGMSWESTIPYYRHINQQVRERLGGHHSARLVLYSVDFAPIERLMREDDWESAGQVLAQAARVLESAGAECIVLCTNTLHKVEASIRHAVRIPFLHICDATARELVRNGHTVAGLLGTRFTMEQDFYRDRFSEHGIRVLVPPESDRALVHRVVFDELCMGALEDASRREYRRIMADLAQAGAQAIILGCTEISLLVGPQDATVPLYDTTAIHARAATEWALDER